jgi:hypothetical protein
MIGADRGPSYDANFRRGISRMGIVDLVPRTGG